MGRILESPAAKRLTPNSPALSEEAAIKQKLKADRVRLIAAHGVSGRYGLIEVIIRRLLKPMGCVFWVSLE